MCSVNYLHKGAEKYWVMIRSEDVQKLERRLKPWFKVRFGEHWTKPRCS